MSLISREDFVKKVRVELDRNREVSPLLTGTASDPDTLELDEIIVQNILPSLQFVYERAPLEMLSGVVKELPLSGMEQGLYQFTEAQNVYYLELPTDFLRLVLFQMANWPVGVTEAITDDDPRSLLFGSKYPGISGTEESPRCLITYATVGTSIEQPRRVLVYYASQDGDLGSAKRYYVPVPEDDGGDLKVPSRLLPAVVAMCASMTCRTLQDEKGVQLLEQKVNILLSLTSN